MLNSRFHTDLFEASLKQNITRYIWREELLHGAIERASCRIIHNSGEDDYLLRNSSIKLL
jgi:hypothetical protein